MGKETTKKDLNVIIIVILTLILLTSSFFILKNKNSGTAPFNFDKEDSTSEKNSSSDINNADTNENSIIENLIETIKEVVTPSCSEKQITYSMINFNKTIVCNQNQSNVCIDKTISCSIKIKNGEFGIDGFFEVKLTFIEGINKENAFNSTTSRFFLKSGQSKILADSINIQSTEQDGLANKEINCFYNTIEVPKKEVC